MKGLKQVIIIIFMLIITIAIFVSCSGNAGKTVNGKDDTATVNISLSINGTLSADTIQEISDNLKDTTGMQTIQMISSTPSASIEASGKLSDSTTAKTVKTTIKTTAKPAVTTYKPATEGTRIIFKELQTYNNAEFYVSYWNVLLKLKNNGTMEGTEYIGIPANKPVSNAYAVSKGEFSDTVTINGFKYQPDTKFYKVNYKNDFYYILEDYMAIKGDPVKGADGKTYRVGDIVYKGKNHDIMIAYNGKRLCTDICGENDMFYPEFYYDDLWEDFEEGKMELYADADYTDPSTNKIYSVCYGKRIYNGSAGEIFITGSGFTVKMKDEEDMGALQFRRMVVYGIETYGDAVEQANTSNFLFNGECFWHWETG